MIFLIVKQLFQEQRKCNECGNIANLISELKKRLAYNELNHRFIVLINLANLGNEKLRNLF